VGIRGRCALRLGLRQIKGFAEADAERLVTARGAGYADAADLWRRSGLGRAALERLAEADALRSLNLDRRRGLWALKALGETPLPLFAAVETNVIPGRPRGPSPESMHMGGEDLGAAGAAQSGRRCAWIPGSLATRGPRNDSQQASKDDLPLSQRLAAKKDSETHAAALLPEMPLGEHVVEDYATLGLTIKRHPLAFLRAELKQEGLVMAADLATLPVDRRVSIAGLVLIRQRPGSANGVVFVTLEDETGIANLIVWPATLERFRRAALGATLLYCRGRLQREESVIHIVAEDLKDWTRRLNTLRDRTGNEPPFSARKPPFALPERIPGYDPREIVIPSRDFR
jgi:error-prone DNA polymerase